MIVTAWNNGRHQKSGAGYGIRLNVEDRNRYFDGRWKTVWLHLEGDVQSVEVNVDKPSFWNATCRELINAAIGVWLRRKGLAPWPRGNPPRLTLEHVQRNHFRLTSP